MFVITETARAELEKRRKRTRDAEDAATPLHAQAEGHQEFHEEERARREQAAKVSRHPDSGRFVADPQHPYIADGHASDSPGNPPATPRPATAWPGSDAHAANEQGARLTQVGDRHAPSPITQTAIATTGAERVSGPSFTPGTTTVQRLDFTTGSPTHPATAPTRPGFHTAPINTAGGN